jgi:hypothetical protein
MIFVREHDEFARNTACLQRVEHSQAFGYGQAVVELAVYDL